MLSSTCLFVCVLIFLFLGYYFSLWHLPFLDLSFTVVAYFLINILFSEYKPQRLLYYGILLSTYLFVVQVGSYFLMITFPWNNDEILSYGAQSFIYYFTPGIILSITGKIFMDLIKKHKIKHIDWRQSMCMCCLGIFEVYILWVYVINFNNQMMSLFILFLGFVSIDIYINVLFEHSSLEKETYERQVSKDYQSQMLKIQYELISKQEIETQKLLHDMKAHLKHVEALYVDKPHSQKSAAYIKKIDSELNQKHRKYFSGKRKLLEILINEFYRGCRTYEIEMTIEVENLSFRCLSDFEMTTLFANLFNNAIEASQEVKVKKPWINLKIWSFEEQIMINLSNYFEKEIKIRDDRMISTKENHNGFGLEKIVETVEECGGSIIVTTIDSVFTTSINLPEKLNSD